MAKTKLNFAEELKKYGAEDFEACYNCGNCSAICNLTNKDDSFPRELIRFSVLGLKQELKGSIKPWLCYYCGECSTKCPRQAFPGELMMAIRRWQISTYDWTGLSGILYKKTFAYIIAFILTIAMVLGISEYLNLTHEKIMHYGHLFEMFAIGGVFTFILLPNIIRMWYWSIYKHNIKFNFMHYFKALGELFTHMFTQKRTLSCEDTQENKIWWFEHMILVLGYLALLFTTVFLDWFGSKNMIVVYFGYIVSAVVFIVTFDFVIRRIRKSSEKTTFTHPSDWFFVIWLFLMGISAFVVRLFIDLNLLENSFFIYYFHLIVLVQWAIIIVPFGKWSHFLYRSFAMYFDKILKIK